jgi:alpha-tubulin suppressor-like RCC1 family protein
MSRNLRHGCLAACALIFLTYTSVVSGQASIPADGDIAVGGDFNIALTSAGVVKTWGSGESGQLGNKTFTPYQSSPVTAYYYDSGQAASFVINNGARISAGYAHALIVRSGGGMVAFGSNDSGQLGDGTTTKRGTAQSVKNLDGSVLSGVVGAAAGDSHSLAVKGNGTVFAWGLNDNGQLGNGTTVARSAAIQVKTGANTFLTGVASVSAGSGHSLALKLDGTVWAWGANSNGQLGDGTTTDQYYAAQIPGLTGKILQVLAGNGVSYIRYSTDPNATTSAPGSVIAIGRTWPAPTNLGSDNIDIATTANGVVACKANGTVWEWTSNLPDGLKQMPSPENLPVANFIKVAGNKNGSNFAALRSDGLVVTFLGGHGHGEQSQYPRQVADAKNAATVVAGGLSSAVYYRLNGSRLFLGSTLGSGTNEPASPPMPIATWPGDTWGFGYLHTLNSSNTGTFAAGENDYSGVLGSGDTISSPTPKPVVGLGATQSLAASYAASFGVNQNGNAYSWGSPTSFQLGYPDWSSDQNPAQNYRVTPKQIATLSNVRKIAPNLMWATHALKNDGTVWSWGMDVGGILGLGTNTFTETPVQNTNLTGISDIQAGYLNNIGLTTSGRVYTWGMGGFGMIGDGTLNDRASPYLIPTTSLANVSKIALTWTAAYALLSNGTVKHWGYTGASNSPQTTPQLLKDASGNTITDVTEIAANSATFYYITTKCPATSPSNTARPAGRWLYAIGQEGPNFGVDTPNGLLPWRLKPSATDSDNDAMDDAWEISNFGSITITAGTEDQDKDGLTDVQEYYRGSPPMNPDADGDFISDFADSDRNSLTNANSYSLSILAGDNQAGGTGTNAVYSLRLRVLPPSPSVYIGTSDPSMRLAATPTALAGGTDSVVMSTDYNGYLDVYYRHRATPGFESIHIQSGVDSIIAYGTALSASEMVDSDGDGLPDGAESIAGTINGVKDTDGDGVKDGWDYAPTSSTLSAPPNTSLLNMTLVTPGTAVRIY